MAQNDGKKKVANNPGYDAMTGGTGAYKETDRNKRSAMLEKEASKVESDHGSKETKDRFPNTPVVNTPANEGANHSNMHENINPANTIHNVAPVQKGK